MAPDYFKAADGNWINLATLLDEKTKRAGLGDNFAAFAAQGIYTKEAPFVPRTTFTVPGTTKCQIYVPQFTPEKGADPLPPWKPKREIPNGQYPYYFLTFIPAVHKRNSTQNNSILNEMFPTNSAMLNPALARKLNIVEGQTIRIRSRVGAIELPAHLTETIRADAVLVPHGFGHRSRYLTKASGKGVRDGDVIPDQTAEEMFQSGNFGGSACIMDAVVAIEPL
jgi:thiosulfate reductase/polysulfide reductase chain A